MLYDVLSHTYELFKNTLSLGQISHWKDGLVAHSLEELKLAYCFTALN